MPDHLTKSSRAQAKAEAKEIIRLADSLELELSSKKDQQTLDSIRTDFIHLQVAYAENQRRTQALAAAVSSKEFEAANARLGLRQISQEVQTLTLLLKDLGPCMPEHEKEAELMMHSIQTILQESLPRIEEARQFVELEKSIKGTGSENKEAERLKAGYGRVEQIDEAKHLFEATKKKLNQCASLVLEKKKKTSLAYCTLIKPVLEADDLFLKKNSEHTRFIAEVHHREKYRKLLDKLEKAIRDGNAEYVKSANRRIFGRPSRLRQKSLHLVNSSLQELMLSPPEHPNMAVGHLFKVLEEQIEVSEAEHRQGSCFRFFTAKFSHSEMARTYRKILKNPQFSDVYAECTKGGLVVMPRFITDKRLLKK